MNFLLEDILDNNEDDYESITDDYNDDLLIALKLFDESDE